MSRDERLQTQILDLEMEFLEERAKRAMRVELGLITCDGFGTIRRFKEKIILMPWKEVIQYVYIYRFYTKDHLKEIERRFSRFVFMSLYN